MVFKAIAGLGSEELRRKIDLIVQDAAEPYSIGRVTALMFSKRAEKKTNLPQRDKKKNFVAKPSINGGGGRREQKNFSGQIPCLGIKTIRIVGSKRARKGCQKDLDTTLQPRVPVLGGM